MQDRLGATYLGRGRCRFQVWAPLAKRVELVLDESRVDMQPAQAGYFFATVDGVEPGTRYRFALDGGPGMPDPASRHQPEGVDGPSAVVDLEAMADDVPGWSGLSLSDHVIYELHVGTFSPEGTFEGVVPYLGELRDLGVTALELMPVAQFPGDRNWGYDGVYPFAVQDSYGGPGGLARLVMACHRRGLAVVLDVVYNHLGPEGDHLAEFGPYFSNRYRTPWGKGMNFDGPGSEGVRRFFVENAVQWIEDYRIDGLRLDAADRIEDRSPTHILRELADTVHARAADRGRRVHLIAESCLDGGQMVEGPDHGGYGLDAQWADDFHHSVHALLTGDRAGYYGVFGALGQLARTYRDAFIYGDAYVPHGRRIPASPAADIPAERFVVYAQNHDQVGNPMFGERLAMQAGFEELKLAAGLVLLSPFVPLLFMGEEYGEEAPFPFFVSFSDPALAAKVRGGRISDFASFEWAGRPPDPGDESTFESARLHHELAGSGRHRLLRTLYRELLRLRREVPALARLSRTDIEVTADETQGVLMVRRWTERDEALAVFSTGQAAASVVVPGGRPRLKRIDSSDERWGGSGTVIPDAFGEGLEAKLEMKPRSFVLLTGEGREREVEG